MQCFCRTLAKQGTLLLIDLYIRMHYISVMIKWCFSEREKEGGKERVDNTFGYVILRMPLK